MLPASANRPAPSSAPTPEPRRGCAPRAWIATAVWIAACATTDLAAQASAGPTGEPDNPAASTPLEVRSVLAVSRAVRGGRTPVFVDPVDAVRIRGWTPPVEGASVSLGSGRRDATTWTRHDADDNGRINARALRSGYAWAEVEAPADEIRLLEGGGFRHVFVNGSPHIGDLYNLRLGRAPVRLRKGTNDLLLRAGRGNLHLRLVAPPAPVFFEARDATLPDAIRGAGGELVLGLIITNATTEWQRDLSVTATAGALTRTTKLPAIPPVTLRKCPVWINVPAEFDAAIEKLPVRLGLHHGDTPLHDHEVALRVREYANARKVTFVSSIDGSVQYYGVRPPHDRIATTGPRPFYLSLHGASVEGGHQASCYGAHDGPVVAPTNRRIFGFDWEDWGRLDALEVFEHATARWNADPRRTYLTGHSMGGHGTWSLGAHFPDRFAAIGPSAGWPDFWAYGGAGRFDDGTPLGSFLNRCANASRTLLLSDNYAHFGVYVLHGDVDRTVPVALARQMRTRLAEFHPNFAYYERAGADHWWGNQCMDWPPMFEFFADNVQPEPSEVRTVRFSTINPGISASCDWVSVHAQVRALEVSTIQATLEAKARKVTVTTDNVAQLGLRLTELVAAGEDGFAAGPPVELVIDDTTLQAAWPSDGQVTAHLSGSEWQLGAAPWSLAKTPDRAGPFKDAFRHRMQFVVATGGDAAMQEWAMAKARFDAEQFWYRGNGAIDIVLDTEFDPAAEPDRGVVLYGNASTNRAWPALLGDAPIKVENGRVTVGDRILEGDALTCLFVRPRPGSTAACVAAVSGTGIVGLRLTDQLPYFVSGVGYPDWMVMDASMPTADGDTGVCGAGFFGPDWSLPMGDAVWR